MKQNITKKQWNELNKKEKNIFFVKTSDFKLDTNPYFKTPNIGQMIEFLEYDLFKLERAVDEEWYIETNIDMVNGCAKLCDALWEAIKYKLNNTK